MSTQQVIGLKKRRTYPHAKQSFKRQCCPVTQPEWSPYEAIWSFKHLHNFHKETDTHSFIHWQQILSQSNCHWAKKIQSTHSNTAQQFKWGKEKGVEYIKTPQLSEVTSPRHCGKESNSKASYYMVLFL